MTVPGNLSSPLLASAAEAAAAGVATKSLRFSSGDSAYLNRTPSSAGNQKTWTWAAWVKRSKLSTLQGVFSSRSGSTGFTIQLGEYNTTNDYIAIYDSNVSGYIVKTSNLLRDVSAWYHVVVAVDSTQSTASDRLKIYINGVEAVYGTDNRSSFSQNTTTRVNSANAHTLGSTVTNDEFFDGYLADVFLIDGSQLDPTSFGAFDDNGVWQAAAYSGTFGTNGFHLLDFANESTVGHDSSGNNNDFTANNISPVAGDPSYITESVLTGTIYPGAGDVDKIFDGTTATCGPNQNSSVTFTPSPAITINSTLRIRANVSSATGSAVFAINGVDKSTVTAGFPTSGGIVNAASTWTTISNPPSSLTSLKFGWGDHWMAVSGIEIDGVELLSDAGSMDILFDVPTNGTQSDTGAGGEVSGNYPTWNPLDKNTNITLSNGNLDAAETSGANHFAGRATFKYPTTGKWYYEATVTTLGGACCIGVDNSGRANPSLANSGVFLILVNSSNNVQRYIGSGYTSFDSAYGNPAVGSVLQVAYDADADKLWLGMGNVWMGSGSSANGNPGAGTEASASNVSDPFPVVNLVTSALSVNFGQRPFAYSAPSGFKALCTTNLPTATVPDGSDYFDAKRYTGNGSTQTVSGLSMSPDLVWLKSRTAADNHSLFDSVRGAPKGMHPNLNNAEFNDSSTLTAFTSDGWTMAGHAVTNANNQNYIGWAWDAGSSTASNTDGSVTSQVRVNQSAGFSIVSYTATGSNLTVGHGLNATPALIIHKTRSVARDWVIYHESLGLDYILKLNLTDAKLGPFTDIFTSVSSSTFGIGTNGGINTNNETKINYCFAPVAGYSAFSSFEANGAVDGPFVHTGFRPALIIFKNIDDSENWLMIDSTRNSANPVSSHIHPNLSNAEAEGSPPWADFLSNGFKLRNLYNETNGSGDTIVFMAWAENPFQANGGLAR